MVCEDFVVVDKPPLLPCFAHVKLARLNSNSKKEAADGQAASRLCFGMQH